LERPQDGHFVPLSLSKLKARSQSLQLSQLVMVPVELEATNKKTPPEASAGLSFSVSKTKRNAI
jgi:hypothetical protein